MKLSTDFYLQPDVVKISKDLLGKVLYTKINGIVTSAIITETEAYAGVTDKASHAYGGRRTKRTETMYQIGGTAYVYLCYGIHHLFNVVTNQANIPHAVLIRAVKPLEGTETMFLRRKKADLNRLTTGPGTLSQALGIGVQHSGISLLKDKIWIEDQGIQINPQKIQMGPRIGVDYAAEDALLPYRFYVHM